MIKLRPIALLICLALGRIASAQNPPAKPGQQAGPAAEGKIPSRPPDAPTGRRFAAMLKDLPAADREPRILEESLRGNIPDFLRRFAPVTVTATGPDGKAHRATFEVLPDYLCVGSDADFLRMPMTPQTAQAIADRFGCLLPTKKMVDDIYAAAEVKLEPKPMTEDRESVATFVKHQQIVEPQRAEKPAGKLTAGHQKDVVITPLLRKAPGKVAIYGWHQPNGKPIQPLTTVHIARYVDYSHGIRLVRGTMTVDGKPTTVAAVLRDPDLCGLLSDEGPVENPRYER